MKYEVEVERKSYFTVEVEADSVEEANAKAIEELQSEDHWKHAEWTPVSIVELDSDEE